MHRAARALSSAGAGSGDVRGRGVAAGAAALLARALAPPLRAARALLAADAAASAAAGARFRTAAEQAVFVEEMEGRRRRSEKSANFRVLERHALRGPGPAGEAAAAADGAAPGPTIAGVHAASFLIIWAAAATTPVLLYAALCAWAERRLASGGASGRAGGAGGEAGDHGDARLTNRKVLDARIQAIERQLASDAAVARAAAAGGAAAGDEAPAAAATTPTDAPQTFESSFLAGVRGELARRSAAMLKPTPLPPPPAGDTGALHAERALARIEARLAALEVRVGLQAAADAGEK